MDRTPEQIIADKMHIALDTYGATLPNWRVNVTGISKAGFDTVWVNVDVIEPHKRKVSVKWELLVDTVRNTVDFTRSHFIDFNHNVSGYGK